MKYPNQYLHVRECASGREWIMPLTSRALLCLKTQLKRWVKREFGGELRLSGDIMPRVDGDYYGQILTDGRSPDSGVVWQSGGFWLE